MPGRRKTPAGLKTAAGVNTPFVLFTPFLLFTPCALFTLLALAIARPAVAQTADAGAAATPAAPAIPASGTPAGSGKKAWRTRGTAHTNADDGVVSGDAQPPLQSVKPARQSIAKVTRGPGTLPNDAGQEWREYDISPYTARVTSTNRPEQAIVDWILRETGYEAWHSEPLGMLSANHRVLRVYHTPEMHAIVSEMVDRFVNSEAESQVFGMRVVSVGSPNWRTKAQRVLHPVTAQSPGVQAWLLAKEDASLLIAELRKRTDFREHSSPHLLVNNGQSTVVFATQRRNYVRDVILRPDAWPGYEPQTAQIDEGFSLEFNPLLSLDGHTVDAIVKCNVDQVEKLIPVMIDVPTAVAPRQRTEIKVPQLTCSRLHERFRWPADHVLLISMGVVASPVPASGSALSLPLSSPTRADLLVFVESKGKLGAQAAAATTAARPAPLKASSYSGRY
jgi:hypothetical protein